MDNKDTAKENDDFFVETICRPREGSTDLRFESRFECGNLGKVVKITDTYYQLYLRRDLYTQRHTQWYYFRVSNTRSRITYRYDRGTWSKLNLKNLSESQSLPGRIGSSQFAEEESRKGRVATFETFFFHFSLCYVISF